MSPVSKDFSADGVQKQKFTAKMDKGHKDCKRAAMNMFEKLSSWRKESNRQFSNIINSHSSLINEGINELVEENCGLKAELKVMKNERSGLLQTVDNLKDEVRQLNTKLRPFPEPKGHLDQDVQEDNGSDVDILEPKVQDLRRHHVSSESKDHEMIGDHVEVSDQQIDEHSKCPSNYGDTMNELNNDLATEDVDSNEDEDDPAERREPEQDETMRAKRKELPLLQKKMYQCSVCGYATSNHQTLRQHKNDVHGAGINKFVCESCIFTCKSSTGLVIHQNWRHSGFNNKYECDLCPYKTSLKKEFWKHAKRTHKKT